MTDLARTLFRLSILEQASSTQPVSDAPSQKRTESLMDVTFENNTSLADVRPSVKRINLEPLDIGSIRESQMKFLDKLHLLHVSD